MDVARETGKAAVEVQPPGYPADKEIVQNVPPPVTEMGTVKPAGAAVPTTEQAAESRDALNPPDVLSGLQTTGAPAFMSPHERRRELVHLAEDMERVFVDRLAR